MTWTYRLYEQNNRGIYAELEDPSGKVIRRYYPMPHPRLRHNPNVASGDEHLPDDDIPAIPVKGFDAEDALQELRKNAHDALPDDDDEPVTAGMLRKTLALVNRDVDRVEVPYQGDEVERGWNRGPGRGPGNGQGGGN